VERDTLSHAVLGAAIAVHRELGPGLLESVYQTCLRFELSRLGIAHRSGVEMPIVYLGHRLDANLRMDLLVEERLILELKSVEALAPVHTAQLLTYLRLSKLQRGLLINFNVPRLMDGVKRVVLEKAQRNSNGNHP
jgi:GxxExxY protein